MSDKYAHVAGCNCASCRKIRQFRKETGNSSWDHKGGCSCSKCRQIVNLREQAEISKKLKGNKK